MREDKWGVLERFTVRPEWSGRVLAEQPDFLQRLIDRHGPLIAAGAHVLGPFEMEHEGRDWWTLLWQFPDREASRALHAILADEDIARVLQVELVEGHKHDPGDGLPGF